MARCSSRAHTIEKQIHNSDALKWQSQFIGQYGEARRTPLGFDFVSRGFQTLQTRPRDLSWRCPYF